MDEPSDLQTVILLAFPVSTCRPVGEMTPITCGTSPSIKTEKKKTKHVQLSSFCGSLEPSPFLEGFPIPCD